MDMDEKKEPASIQIRIRKEIIKELEKILSELKYGKNLFRSTPEFVNFLLNALVDEKELINDLLAKAIQKKE